MTDKTYLPLLMLKGLNIVLNQKITEHWEDGSASMKEDYKINNLILTEALKHPFGAIKYAIRFMPLKLADKIVQSIDPGLPEQYFYRNLYMYMALDTVYHQTFNKNEIAKINIVNLGAGLDWRMDNEIQFYQSKGRNIHYTAVDLPLVMDIRQKILGAKNIKPFVETKNTDYIGIDLNQKNALEEIINSLPQADVNIVWSKAVNMYLQPATVDNIYQQFGTLKNTTFISTTFNSIDLKHDKHGRKQGHFIDYHSAIADKDILDWAEKNKLDMIEYLEPSMWLTFKGMDSGKIDQKPNLERIFVAQGRNIQPF